MPARLVTQENCADYSEFDNPKQADEFIACLRSRVLPLKFAYVGSAAQTHIELSCASDYGLFDTESRLIRATLPSLCNSSNLIKEVNVIDIGPGSGVKASLVIDILSRHYQVKRYLALDYSSKMLEIARNNLLRVKPDLHVLTGQIDFEVEDFGNWSKLVRGRTNRPNLLLLLGHTIGNPRDRGRVMENIRRSMSTQDILLLGAELYNPSGKPMFLAHYQNEPFYRAVFEPLKFIGIRRTDGSINVRFKESTKDIEVIFRLNRTVKTCLKDSTNMILKEGESIIIGVSHRFTELELRSLFADSGLVVNRVLLDSKNLYSLVVGKSA